VHDVEVLPTSAVLVTGTTTRTTVPVMACPTADRSDDRTAAAPVLVGSDARGFSGYDFYVDPGGVMPPVLAPSGWHCVTRPDTETGLALVVVPPGETATLTDRAFRGIVATYSNACEGCRQRLLCAVLPEQAPTLAGTPACREVPSAENLILKGSPGPSGPHIFYFEDPPGITGTGDASGGLYTAHGVLISRTDPGTGPEAWRETCVLPDSAVGACTTLQNTFERLVLG
jgi:hypothetical protein